MFNKNLNPASKNQAYLNPFSKGSDPAFKEWDFKKPQSFSFNQEKSEQKGLLFSFSKPSKCRSKQRKNSDDSFQQHYRDSRDFSFRKMRNERNQPPSKNFEFDHESYQNIFSTKGNQKIKTGECKNLKFEYEEIESEFQKSYMYHLKVQNKFGYIEFMNPILKDPFNLKKMIQSIDIIKGDCFLRNPYLKNISYKLVFFGLFALDSENRPSLERDKMLEQYIANQKKIGFRDISIDQKGNVALLKIYE